MKNLNSVTREGEIGSRLISKKNKQKGGRGLEKEDERTRKGRRGTEVIVVESPRKERVSFTAGQN